MFGILKLIPIKDYIYVGIILSLVGSAWYILDDWHYSRIRDYKVEVISLSKQLKITGSALNVCEANLIKQSLKGFIDGIGENNETIIIDLSNLST